MIRWKKKIHEIIKISLQMIVHPSHWDMPMAKILLSWFKDFKRCIETNQPYHPLLNYWKLLCECDSQHHKYITKLFYYGEQIHGGKWMSDVFQSSKTTPWRRSRSPSQSQTKSHSWFTGVTISYSNFNKTNGQVYGGVHNTFPILNPIVQGAYFKFLWKKKKMYWFFFLIEIRIWISHKRDGNADSL